MRTLIGILLLALVGIATAQPALHYVEVDHLNTPRAISDSSQQLRWRWDQAEPFGVNVPDENPSALGTFEFPVRFPGQYFDKETALAYNYFRDYDPTVGRYIQSDPIGLEGGLNTYLYVGGSPLLSSDPLGLLEIDRSEGVSVRAYSKVSGEHARQGPGESYHVHIRDRQGNVARISTETWKPLTPKDEVVYKQSKPIRNYCENLTEGQKKLLYRVNREVFHRGAPTLAQLVRLVQMRGGGGSAIRGNE
ncbi:MAG: hypothetical protein QOD26_779 [Betaproteobacteria bacterium]|jgi:RHS repeat-associated protein|nr:hypothetical protein [Betaproteobacteria bacterium]